MSKKLMSIVLSLCLVFSIMTVVSFAEDEIIPVGSVFVAEEPIVAQILPSATGNEISPYGSFVQIDIYPTLEYKGSGNWKFRLSAYPVGASVGFKYMNGTATMSGDFGSYGGAKIEGKNPIPMSGISGAANFSFLYPISTSGTAYVKSSGSISSTNATVAVWGPKTSTFHFTNLPA